MTYEYRIELNGCIIDKEHLMAVTELVNKHFGGFHLSFSFEDNTKVGDLSIADFDKYDFSNKAIKDFELRAYQYDSAKKIDNSFSLSHYSFSNNYQLSFSSSDYSFYSLLKSLIEDWIKNVTDSSRLKAIKILKYPSLLAAISAVVLSFCISLATIRLFNIADVWFSMIISVLNTVLMFFVCFLMFDTIKGAFPLTEIDIGFNKFKEHRKRYYFFLTVFIVPLIYMLIGIFVPMFI